MADGAAAKGENSPQVPSGKLVRQGWLFKRGEYTKLCNMYILYYGIVLVQWTADLKSLSIISPAFPNAPELPLFMPTRVSWQGIRVLNLATIA